jgi:hypothetical protein
MCREGEICADQGTQGEEEEGEEEGGGGESELRSRIE